MAEGNIARMEPMREADWDEKGVSALRALADYHKNPEDTLRATGPATDQLRGKIMSLMARVEAIMMNPAESSRPGEAGKTAVEKKDALANVYRALSECRHVRSYAAHRRKVKEEDLGECHTPRVLQLYYLAFPCMLFACAFALQSVLLHFTTHFYVFYMDAEIERGDFQEVGHGRLFDLIGNSVGAASQHSHHGNHTGGVIHGKVEIPTKVLDASGIIPAFLCISAYFYAWTKGQFSIGLWNKTFIVASCMAVLKGVFDVVTILPDSTGWRTCKERLGGQAGVERFLEMKFSSNWIAALLRMAELEVLGDEGKRVRYCADMMVSGHTYFAGLFSLSAYKQTFFSGVGHVCANLVGLLCLCCMTTEVVLVAAARFHYTVDMLAALALVGLLFDSSYVDQLASDWSEGFRWQDPRTFQPSSSPFFRFILNFMRSRYPPSQAADTKPIIASRATGLVNPRVTSGGPPWSWRTAYDLQMEELSWDEKNGLGPGPKLGERAGQPRVTVT